MNPDPLILLTSMIPPPLVGLSPRTILGSSWWRKRKSRAEKDSGGFCRACGIHKSKARYRKWLEGHEVYEVDLLKKTSTFLRVEVLCFLCHNYVHTGRLIVLCDRGKINKKQLTDTIKHGDAILRAAGVDPEEFSIKSRMERIPLVSENDWDHWRLIIEDKEYRPEKRKHRK